MKKLLNTLYVTTEGASVRKEGENIVVFIDDCERGRVPMHLFDSVVLFGAIYISPGLIGACAEAGVTIVLLARSGRFQARVEGPVSGNVLLRRAQYRLSEQPEPIVSSFLVGKISNQRAVLHRFLRDYGGEVSAEEGEAVEGTCQRLAHLARRVAMDSQPLEVLRGIEGEAAGLYFSQFDRMIRVGDPDLRFAGRSRRPPLDAVNALLSFLYTLLTHDCRSAAEGVGLDPAVGFLHRERPGRPSLALDMMEELRPVLVDRLALSLLNRKQLQAKHFSRHDGGAVLLNDEGRKIVLAAWQERKKEERNHPFLNEMVPFGLLPHVQALLLARHVRGDIDAMPPWLWT